MLIDPPLTRQFLKKYQSLLADTYGSLPTQMNEWVAARKAMVERISDRSLFSDVEDLDPEFTESLGMAIYGEFIFLKRYKNYCVLLHRESEMYYGVRSLTTPLEEILPEYSMIYTGIVPYEGFIVCDGLIESKNVLLGMNFAKSVRDGYWNAKRSKVLVTTMEMKNS